MQCTLHLISILHTCAHCPHPKPVTHSTKALTTTLRQTVHTAQRLFCHTPSSTPQPLLNYKRESKLSLCKAGQRAPTGLLIYHVCCDSREISEKEHAPAKATLISMFISTLTGSLSSKAIHNYIYGVQAWHTLYRLPWVLHEDQVHTMLKGAAKLTSLAVKQDKCKPVTMQMMSLIKAELDQTDPFNTAFFACLTTIFYTAAHVGKFTVQRLDAFKPLKHITHRGVCDDTDRNGLHTRVFALPCTKVSPTGEEVNWAKQDRPMTP